MMRGGGGGGGSGREGRGSADSERMVYDSSRDIRGKQASIQRG